MLLEIVSFLKHNGMLQAKQMTNVPLSLPSIAQYLMNKRGITKSPLINSS